MRHPSLSALLAVLLTAVGCGGTGTEAPDDPEGAGAGGGGTASAEPFWTDPDSNAARQAAEYRLAGRTEDAALLDRIATRAQAEWLTGPDPGAVVRSRTEAAAGAGRIAVLVAYYVPGRDCGSYSEGGAGSATAYRAWVDEFAKGLGDRGAYVIVEPDAIAQAVAGCSRIDPEDRYGLLAHAVDRLKRQPGTHVYLDAGNSAWLPDPAAGLAAALTAAGIARADGFALNVSNFQTDASSAAYGGRLSALLDGKHYVTDTSRNGNGPATGPDAWCNPPGRALGRPPTTRTDDPLLDAHLWIKRPGESDGTCRGGPEAGRWWPSYALELARNARP